MPKTGLLAAATLADGVPGANGSGAFSALLECRK